MANEETLREPIRNPAEGLNREVKTWIDPRL